jgi:hypothetical protein
VSDLALKPTPRLDFVAVTLRRRQFHSGECIPRAGRFPLTPEASVRVVFRERFVYFCGSTDRGLRAGVYVVLLPRLEVTGSVGVRVVRRSITLRWSVGRVCRRRLFGKCVY